MFVLPGGILTECQVPGATQVAWLKFKHISLSLEEGINGSVFKVSAICGYGFLYLLFTAWAKLPYRKNVCG